MQVLARSPLTRELSPEDHRDFNRHLSAWAWAEDEPILLAGQEAAGSYLLASGRARITRDTVDGREITVDIAAPGDIIGPVHTAPAPVADSAWAMETTCALYLPAESLAQIVDKYPQVALGIMRLQQEGLASSRGSRIAQSTTTVEQRVAGVLQQLERKFGQQRSDGTSLLQVRLRRDDIAGMAGTTLESASRTMSRMKKQGVIDSGREWIAVVDPAGLAELASQ